MYSEARLFFVHEDIFRMTYDFLVLAAKRSGSHMLATMLNSHPEIACEGEYGNENDTVTIHASDTGKRGCLIHYRQLELVKAPKYIHLVRYPIDCAISQARSYARQTQPEYAEYAAHYVKGEEPRNHEIEPSHSVVSARLRDLSRQLIIARNFFDGKDVLKVHYEGITGNRSVEEMPERMAKRICSFLDVWYHPMKTHFIKGTK